LIAFCKCEADAFPDGYEHCHNTAYRKEKAWGCIQQLTADTSTVNRQARLASNTQDEQFVSQVDRHGGDEQRHDFE
jgi:hypothetical protein